MRTVRTGLTRADGSPTGLCRLPGAMYRDRVGLYAVLNDNAEAAAAHVENGIWSEISDFSTSYSYTPIAWI